MTGITDDEFPLDKPELADAALKRFRATQDASVVRDLVRSLKSREAEIESLTTQRDTMTTPLCGTCRHWGNAKDANQVYRQCQAVVHDSETHPDDDENAMDACNQKNYPDGYAERVAFRAAHKAVVLDGSGYLAALKTRDDFGCVLHEPQ